MLKTIKVIKAFLEWLITTAIKINERKWEATAARERDVARQASYKAEVLRSAQAAQIQRIQESTSRRLDQVADSAIKQADKLNNKIDKLNNIRCELEDV